MAYKQYGPPVQRRPLSQVRRKVARAYGGSPRGRSGYTDGLSPYFPSMASALRAAIPPPSAVVEWRPRSREVVVAEEAAPIRYSRLVYAGSLSHLAAAVGQAPQGAEYAPATLALYGANGEVDVNNLIYDLRPGSPIFRVFTPRSRVALVQYSQLSTGGTEREAATKSALWELFHRSFEIIGQETLLPKAYPMESLTPDAQAAMDTACADLGILRFGREAMARYVDLHELPWSDLERWCHD